MIKINPKSPPIIPPIKSDDKSLFDSTNCVESGVSVFNEFNVVIKFEEVCSDEGLVDVIVPEIEVIIVVLVVLEVVVVVAVVVVATAVVVHVLVVVIGVVIEIVLVDKSVVVIVLVVVI
jgi:hypothetical protein